MDWTTVEGWADGLRFIAKPNAVLSVFMTKMFAATLMLSSLDSHSQISQTFFTPEPRTPIFDCPFGMDVALCSLPDLPVCGLIEPLPITVTHTITFNATTSPTPTEPLVSTISFDVPEANENSVTTVKGHDEAKSKTPKDSWTVWTIRVAVVATVVSITCHLCMACYNGYAGIKAWCQTCINITQILADMDARSQAQQRQLDINEAELTESRDKNSHARATLNDAISKLMSSETNNNQLRSEKAKLLSDVEHAENLYQKKISAMEKKHQIDLASAKSGMTSANQTIGKTKSENAGLRSAIHDRDETIKYLRQKNVDKNVQVQEARAQAEDADRLRQQLKHLTDDKAKAVIAFAELKEQKKAAEDNYQGQLELTERQNESIKKLLKRQHARDQEVHVLHMEKKNLRDSHDASRSALLASEAECQVLRGQNLSLQSKNNSVQGLRESDRQKDMQEKSAALQQVSELSRQLDAALGAYEDLSEQLVGAEAAKDQAEYERLTESEEKQAVSLQLAAANKRISELSTKLEVAEKAKAAAEEGYLQAVSDSGDLQAELEEVTEDRDRLRSSH